MTDLDGLLDHAARSRVEGGFGYLGDDGRVVPGRPVETWITARMTHVFGLAALLGRPGADELVRHGVAALTGGPLHDARHGGWRAATDDDTKGAYVHAFVLLAGATATAAGAEGGAALLDQALATWQERFWDDAAGAPVEEWDAAWTRCSDYRGANATMHGVEATLAAADALAGRDGAGDAAGARQLREQALRSTHLLVHEVARPRQWRLPEHFTPAWEPLPDYNRDRPADPFRPFGVTVGHQFEWARLALHVRAALGEDAPDWLLPDALALFDAAADRGEGADGHAGFPYTLDWSDRPVVGARMHWVLCEAVAAATVLGAVTGEPRHGELARRWWAYGERAFADPVTGSWHHELTAEGGVGGSTWAGQPDAYHLAQALLLPGRPVRGSLAAALR